MDNLITEQKLKKYFKITKEAFEMSKRAPYTKAEERKEILEMVGNYLSDAEHFYRKGDFINAFACLNYAHGWLDCGARLKIYKVNDSRLFAAD